MLEVTVIVTVTMAMTPEQLTLGRGSRRYRQVRARTILERTGLPATVSPPIEQLAQPILGQRSFSGRPRSFAQWPRLSALPPSAQIAGEHVIMSTPTRTFTDTYTDTGMHRLWREDQLGRNGLTTAAFPVFSARRT